VRIGAKDQSNCLVAGSSRNVSQDSGVHEARAVERMLRTQQTPNVRRGLRAAEARARQWAVCGKHGLQEGANPAAG